jgi:hypothetical protein
MNANIALTFLVSGHKWFDDDSDLPKYVIISIFLLKLVEADG